MYINYRLVFKVDIEPYSLGYHPRTVVLRTYVYINHRPGYWSITYTIQYLINFSSRT